MQEKVRRVVNFAVQRSGKWSTCFASEPTQRLASFRERFVLHVICSLPRKRRSKTQRHPTRGHLHVALVDFQPLAVLVRAASRREEHLRRPPGSPSSTFAPLSDSRRRACIHSYAAGDVCDALSSDSHPNVVSFVPFVHNHIHNQIHNVLHNRCGAGVCFVRVDLRGRQGKAKEGPRGTRSTATMAQLMRTRCAPKSAWKRSNRNDVRVQASATPAGGSKTRVKDTVELGASGVHVSAVGAGAWSWGDRSGYWGYGKEYGKDASKDAYQALMEGGVNFIDTAEVYGFGMSEEFLGEFMKESKGKFDQDPAVATKFAPLPWRFTEDSVVDALKDSLKRLGRDKVELYMQHWPGFFLNAFSNDAYLNGLAKCKEMGLADAIGVSNFNKTRLREAHEKLGAKGVALASNQVQYSLIYREPESNGVMETCKELGITLVAYSPLAQGLLTGKYSLSNKPTGPRKGFFTDEKLRQVEPLVGLMKEIGQGHGDKTPAQVAINWTICKGALPIPGVKTVRQAEEVIGSIGWRLTEDEMSSLEKLARGITSLGAPFENW